MFFKLFKQFFQRVHTILTGQKHCSPHGIFPLIYFWPHLSKYLQIRHSLLKGLRVVPQGLLLLQELGVPSFSSWLEEAIVVNVPQWLVERADDLLFSVPHGAVQVKLETPLTDREHRARWRSEVSTPWTLSRIIRRIRRSNIMTNVSKSNPCCHSWYINSDAVWSAGSCFIYNPD